MASASDEPQVFKVHRSRGARLWRLIGSSLDPRALIHAFRLLNFYNYSHVTELRRVRCGTKVAISPNAILRNGGNIVLGNRISIGAHANLWAGPGNGRIVIGDDCLIGPSVMLTAANYRFDDGSPVTLQAMAEADIVLGNDVWIGFGAIVLPGVTIGDRAIVGAGAVVRQNVPQNAIVAGNPAKVVGTRRISKDAGGDLGDRPVDPRILETILAEISPLGREALQAPLDRSGVDSFGLMTLRMAVEAQAGQSITDRDWTSIRTLEDIARVVPTRPAVKAAPSLARPASVEPALLAVPSTGEVRGPGHVRRDFVINMPQMALAGLGEGWLFKELGDLHWAMITDYLGMPSSRIFDDTGGRLYATFTRIRLDADPHLRGFRENDALSIEARLERYGAGFFFGEHRISGSGADGRAQTMSTFAKYGERGENTSLMKGTPTLPDPDPLPSLQHFPDFGAEYRTRRAAEPAATLFECEYDILGPHDINGVGLLYFAAYPMIFDICVERHEGRGFLLDYSTVSKDVCYYANSEPTDTLRFRLHRREQEGDLIHHAASLSRGSDGRRMADVIMTKRRLGRPIPA